ncbi:DUF6691 family protein [Rhodocyclus gracilis]|uniref:DUF6691 family protein n=1 Tax=Rhodocyclus gracilis TaxID=2929842 RepID=UPI003BF464D2
MQGSALFGIGWGIYGNCPGPAIALLAAPDNPETTIFLTGLATGISCIFSSRSEEKRRQTRFASKRGSPRSYRCLNPDRCALKGFRLSSPPVQGECPSYPPSLSPPPGC